MARLPKPLFFGLAGTIGCLASSLLLGEAVLTLLLPPSRPPGPPPAPQVDVIFVLDTTSSMGPQIEGVRRGIIDFAGELSARKLDARIGLIAFQDEMIGEAPRILSFSDGAFTHDFAKFRTEVGRLAASGGGDTPESSLNALALAADQSFRPEATKVVLLITDAPPKLPDRSISSIEQAAGALKARGINQLHLVCQPNDRDRFYKALQASAPGDFFNLNDAKDGTGFARVLPSIGSRIAEITISSRQGLVTRSEVMDEDQGQLTLAITVWTGLLASAIGLSLVAGQNLYLLRPWMTRSEALKAGLGGLASGMVAGFAGQYLAIKIVTGWAVIDALSRLLGWVLLGALVGAGMSFFVRNLAIHRALIGGAAGGFVGAIGFAVASALFGDLAGRQIGAGLLGFCIGAVIAWVEQAYRSYFLSVSYGPGEIRKVNLGDAPVNIGSDSTRCTIWIAGASPIACSFLLRSRSLLFTDVAGGREQVEVRPGFRNQVGKVEVTVMGITELPASVEAVAPRVVPAPKSPEPAEVAKADRPPIPQVVMTSAQPAPPSKGCPNCGYQVAGPPGRRYCMICGDHF